MTITSFPKFRRKENGFLLSFSYDLQFDDLSLGDELTIKSSEKPDTIYGMTVKNKKGDFCV
jgi:hypothetical protein